MQAQKVVPDSHFAWIERNILQTGGILLREREVFLHYTGLLVRAGDLIIRKTTYLHEPAVVDYALELGAAFEETSHSFLVLHLFRGDESPRERVEVAHRAAALPGGFGEEQVAVVPQVRTFIEMPLE